MSQVSIDISFQIRLFTAENFDPVDKIISSPAYARVRSEFRKAKFEMKAGCFLKPGGLNPVLRSVSKFDKNPSSYKLITLQ